MAESTRYAKPCMTNLPPELGRAIFKQMLNSPKPDEDEIEAKVRKLEKQMIAARERENA